MLTTARHAPTAPTRATVTRHIDAPMDTVFSLLADVHSWPRWGPFTDTGTPARTDQPEGPHPVRLGRHRLCVALSSPDAPYWVRYRLTGGPARNQHTAEVTLSPTDDGGTDLHWRAIPTRHLPGTARRRTAALETVVAGLAAQLASAAEDPATTRAEWAHARHDGATAPVRSPAAVPAGDAVAA
jgi:uncharacterized protein YndB with AHSA1/START domain